MNNPIDHLRIGGVEKQNKAQPWANGAQIGMVQSASPIFSTPFPKNRYQILATFWERCRSFCKKTPAFYKDRVKKCFFLFCTSLLQYLRTESGHLLLKFDLPIKFQNKESCTVADKELFFIPIEGKLIEVEENVYIAYYKMGRRERYLVGRDQKNGVLSYDALDQDGIVGQEMMNDPEADSLEELVMAKELKSKLHLCIEILSKSERELIQAIYFDGMSDTEYSKRIRKSQQTVGYRRKKVLSKLKRLMNF